MIYKYIVYNVTRTYLDRPNAAPEHRSVLYLSQSQASVSCDDATSRQGQPMNADFLGRCFTLASSDWPASRSDHGAMRRLSEM